MHILYCILCICELPVNVIGVHILHQRTTKSSTNTFDTHVFKRFQRASKFCTTLSLHSVHDSNKIYTIHTNTKRCMVACTTKRFSHSSHSLCCKMFTQFKHGNPFGSPRSHSIWQSILTYCHILLLNTHYRNINFKAYFNSFIRDEKPF